MLNRYVQFNHINPLIYRIVSKVKELEQIIEIIEEDTDGDIPVYWCIVLNGNTKLMFRILTMKDF